MERRVKPAIIVAVIVLAIILNQSPLFGLRDILRQTVAWPANVVLTVKNQLGQTWQLIGSIGQLSSQNAKLTDENTRLKSQVAELAAAEGENARLRQDLGLKQSGQLDVRAAEVILTSPDGQLQTVIINRGLTDGLKVGQAVISNGYLVGRLESVNSHTSTVRLITSPQAVTPVNLTGSQTIGVMRGSIKGLVIENIPSTVEVKTGEPIVTSALESRYPSGLPVGQVEEVVHRKEDVFVSVRVLTPINLNNLSTVLVVNS